MVSMLPLLFRLKLLSLRLEEDPCPCGLFFALGCPPVVACRVKDTDEGGEDDPAVELLDSACGALFSLSGGEAFVGLVGDMGFSELYGLLTKLGPSLCFSSSRVRTSSSLRRIAQHGQASVVQISTRCLPLIPYNCRTR
jgi:hypothetical protein